MLIWIERGKQRKTVSGNVQRGRMDEYLRFERAKVGETLYLEGSKQHSTHKK